MLPLLGETTWENRNLPHLEGGCECYLSNGTDMLLYPHYPSSILIFHLKVGLVQWFLMCCLWTNIISTTWKHVKLQTFGSYIKSIEWQKPRVQGKVELPYTQIWNILSQWKRLNDSIIKRKKYGEITKNKTTTKAYRILYPAMPGAQYNTNMFILYVCSYLFMTKNFIRNELKQKLVYLVNQYLLDAWWGSYTVLGTVDILWK